MGAGVTSGSYTHVFDLTLSSTYTNGFLVAHGGPVGAESALLSAMDEKKAYLDIHTSSFPGGEIRGFLEPQAAATPEPASLTLLGIGIAGMAGYGWRRRKLAAAA